MKSPETPETVTTVPLVEVLDQSRRVVALLPVDEVVRQKLRHRTVAILLFDEMGRLHLRRSDPKSAHGRWDASVRGPVLAGESGQDAATRCLVSGLGIHSERLKPILELPAVPENANEFMQVFTLTRPETPAGKIIESETRSYYFTSEELNCLLRDFRELVSPRLLFLAESLNLKGLWRRRP